MFGHDVFKHASFCSHGQSVLYSIKTDITHVCGFTSNGGKRIKLKKKQEKKKEKRYFQSKPTWYLHQQGAVIKLCPEELQRQPQVVWYYTSMPNLQARWCLHHSGEIPPWKHSLGKKSILCYLSDKDSATCIFVIFSFSSFSSASRVSSLCGMFFSHWIKDLRAENWSYFVYALFHRSYWFKAYVDFDLLNQPLH